MPTRCNRGFYCRSYCLLNMFRAPLCPSSGVQEYYTVVLWFSSCWSGVDLRVMCPVCRMLTCFGHTCAHHQEFKSIIQWLLPVVFGAVFLKLLVWGGAEGYVYGLQDANMFRAPLCPSSGAQEYYTVVTACGISCCGFKVVGLW